MSPEQPPIWANFTNILPTLCKQGNNFSTLSIANVLYLELSIWAVGIWIVDSLA